jgi:plastocyanin domain-containing protein
MRALFVVSVAVPLAAVTGCKKDEASSAAAKAPAVVTAPATAGTVGSDGVRRIPVEANAKGFTPDRIAGKAGEKLDLVFTRTDDTECISQVKADGKTYDLPKDKPVEVALVTPASGELGFACGMDMYKGAVVVAP